MNQENGFGLAPLYKEEELSFCPSCSSVSYVTKVKERNVYHCENCGNDFGQPLKAPEEALAEATKKVMDSGIPGVGKDAEIHINDAGGKQSRMDRAFHLLPARAIFDVAEVLHEGAAKYEPTTLSSSLAANWRRIDPHEHVNHALQHLFAYLAGDTSDNHLGHAMCRVMFAQDMILSGTSGERAAS